MQDFEPVMDNDKKFLVKQLLSEEKVTAYAVSWLLSVRNRYFLKLHFLDHGYSKELYTDISGYITLAEVLQTSIKADDLVFILKRICQAVIDVQDSLLDLSHISFETNQIWVKIAEGSHKKAEDVKLFYSPIQKSREESLSQQQVNDRVQALCEELLELLLAKLSQAKRKKLRDKLLIAAADGPSTLLELLNTTFTPAEKQVKAMDKKIQTQYLNLPIIIIIVQVFILIILFLIDRIRGQVPLNLVILGVFVLALFSIFQVVLLIHPASPFCPFLYGKEKPSTGRESIPAVSDSDPLNLHPEVPNRTANLTMLAGVKHNRKVQNWQILGSEFLIGSDPERCNLVLTVANEEKETILRICQRAGYFFAQALSTKNSVWLQDRLLYRYEDYLLPDECQLKISNTVFRFRAY